MTTFRTRRALMVAITIASSRGFTSTQLHRLRGPTATLPQLDREIPANAAAARPGAVSASKLREDAERVAIGGGSRSGRMIVSERQGDVALFGLGCFWAPQANFRKVPGVLSATAGYAYADEPRGGDQEGGAVPSGEGRLGDGGGGEGRRRERPSYFSVCRGDGHTECVRVAFDPRAVSYEALLQVFWAEHDASAVPVSAGGQESAQYRSVVWPLTKAQRLVAKADVARAAQSYAAAGFPPPRTLVAETATGGSMFEKGGERGMEAADASAGDSGDHGVAAAASTAVDAAEVADAAWAVADAVFTPAEGYHQDFWCKAQAKAMLCAGLLALPHLPSPELAAQLAPQLSAVSEYGLKALFAWWAFENFELMLAAFPQLG